MGSTARQSQFNINNIATSLNEKAERDFVNITPLGRLRGSSWAMPSESYEELVVGPTDTQYTAPANGYMMMYAHATNSTNRIVITNLTVGYIGNEIDMLPQDNHASVYCPVKKGDTVTIGLYNATADVVRFYYAVGAQTNIEDDIDINTLDKETVIGWCMPDYSTEITKEFDNLYTADEYYWAAAYTYHPSATTMVYIEIYDENDNLLREIADCGSLVAGHGSTSCATCFIPKGYKYRARYGGSTVPSTQYLYIHPLKGVE